MVDSFLSGGTLSAGTRVACAVIERVWIGG